jgi:NUMOD4 motif
MHRKVFCGYEHNPVRQCAAVRRQCASALLSVSAPVRQRVYIRAHTRTHSAHPSEVRMVGQCAEAEQWGPIAGWEGFYEVSDRGRVRSLDTPQPL